MCALITNHQSESAFRVFLFSLSPDSSHAKTRRRARRSVTPPTNTRQEALLQALLRRIKPNNNMQPNCSGASQACKAVVTHGDAQANLTQPSLQIHIYIHIACVTHTQINFFQADTLIYERHVFRTMWYGKNVDSQKEHTPSQSNKHVVENV